MLRLWFLIFILFTTEADLSDSVNDVSLNPPSDNDLKVPGYGNHLNANNAVLPNPHMSSATTDIRQLYLVRRANQKLSQGLLPVQKALVKSKSDSLQKNNSISVRPVKQDRRLTESMVLQDSAHSEPCESSEEFFCLNGGTCLRLTTLKTNYCVCMSGFEGGRCEEKSLGIVAAGHQMELKVLEDSPHSEICPGTMQRMCVNGGTCYRLIAIGIAYCACSIEFQGGRCELRRSGTTADTDTKPDPHAQVCLPALRYFCLNGGTCARFNGFGTVYCICTRAFEGERCELRKPGVPDDRNPEPLVLCDAAGQSYCLNGATCYLLHGPGTAYCLCPDRFEGFRCEKDTMPTPSDPEYKPHSVLCETAFQSYCLNGGTCYRITELKREYCACANAFEGVRCEQKHTGIPADGGLFRTLLNKHSNCLMDLALVIDDSRANGTHNAARWHNLFQSLLRPLLDVKPSDVGVALLTLGSYIFPNFEVNRLQTKDQVVNSIGNRPINNKEYRGNNGNGKSTKTATQGANVAPMKTPLTNYVEVAGLLKLDTIVDALTTATCRAAKRKLAARPKSTKN